MSEATLILLTVVEAVVLVLVLAVALLRIRRRLVNIAEALGTLGSALGGIEGRLALIRPAAAKINAPLRAIVGALPGIAEKAEIVARG